MTTGGAQFGSLTNILFSSRYYCFVVNKKQRASLLAADVAKEEEGVAAAPTNNEA